MKILVGIDVFVIIVADVLARMRDIGCFVKLCVIYWTVNDNHIWNVVILHGGMTTSYFAAS